MLDFLLNLIQIAITLGLLAFIFGFLYLISCTDVLDPKPGLSERELNDIHTVNNATEFRNDFAL